ncbi:MAG: phosphoenolpyruvate carboxykinase (ATP) [Chlorobi bacterium]|nr:phosphoenolpyruvate carboxykinase (ATP) [Chlorobiota bacterium]
MSKYLKFDTPAMKHAGDLASIFKLKNHGLKELKKVFWNLPTAALYEEASFRGEGKMVYGGPFLVNTGKWTARAANDKYVVQEPSTIDKIWWGEYNRPMSQEKFTGAYSRLLAYLQGEELFVQDCYVGADENYRMPIRIITDTAWQSLFARNMFIQPKTQSEMKEFVPEFTLIASPKFKVDPVIDGTRSETAMCINFAEKLALVMGSSYGGEIKKTMFTVMNFLKPLENVMAMHCSANVGKEKNDAALFFGLSGTGKTTLSADPKRNLIGDDEHGWSDEGIFNFENGCYAKVIRLSASAEPEIFECTRKFGTILENVVFDPTSRRIDLDDESLTENTRASYPLDFIPNAVPEKKVDAHPENVIFLTCDATGVLPPIARLDMDHAMYHFISGYTSKIAGTEIGLGIEPEIAFSACFGAPFMVHHPFYYANLLRQKMEKSNSRCWLVNTGWVGGKFGVGKRISIRHTRNMLNAALDGKLDNVEYRTDPLFGFDVPVECPDVPQDVLEPSNAWGNKEEYWSKYDALSSLYIENFKQYLKGVTDDVIAAGPKRYREIKK